MTKTITIQGVQVDVQTPYEAGHQVTEAEAKALNTIRAENIGNNKRAQIKEMLEAAGGDASKVQKEAQKLVADYDSSYEFTLASAGGGSTRLDPLEKEARAIAREYVSAAIKEKGLTQKEYLEQNGEDAIKNKIAEVAENEKVIAMAKKSLAAKAKMAEDAPDLKL